VSPLLAAVRAPFLDHSTVDFAAATQLTYRLEQRFRYTYDEPIHALTHRLVAVPRRRHGSQLRRAHRVNVLGASNTRRTSLDGAGNTVVQVTASRVERTVEFHIAAIIEAVRGPTLLPIDALSDPALRDHTRLTAPDSHLREMAARLARPRGDPFALAERVCTAVYAAVVYELDVTTVATTAAEALAVGRGVCQDSAHVMLALARLCGLPARYVSGHLVGQGGTHAWVEVVVPHAGGAAAIAFDPCHGRRTDHRYVTVAVGRDYADVAPTSGTFIGRSGGHLATERQVGIVSVG
jgi:transglutaminase-like putative cysteine protease